jgi:hypothetical protein
MVEMTVEAITKQLSLVANSDAYRWNLPWAPTYSALMLTFIGMRDPSIGPYSVFLLPIVAQTNRCLTAALALCLARFQPHLIDWSSLLATSKTIAEILEEYPYPNFALLIRELMEHAPSHTGSLPRGGNAAAFYGWTNNNGLAIGNIDANTVINGSQENDKSVSRVSATPYAASQSSEPSRWSSQQPNRQLHENSVQTSATIHHGATWDSSFSPQQSFPPDFDYQFSPDMESSSMMLSLMFDYNAFTASMGGS